jgi:DNA-binding transcriptional ArsR family regulator
MSRRSHTRIGWSPDLCLESSHDEAAVREVSESRSGDELLVRTAALFSSMSDPTRLRLLEALSIRELCVCDLTDLSGVSQSGVSHQLRVLRKLGLVTFQRDANRAIYRLADDHVRALLRQGFDHAAEEIAK